MPSGYKLHWYVLGTVVGQGGFGITYLAVDTNLDQRVAIKEFLPVELVTRSSDSQVHPLSTAHGDTYGWGLNRFVTEARTLAKFRHPNIVRVMSVFEANNTAYMVMEYEQGESLEDALKVGSPADEGNLRDIIMPLLDGLKMVHEAGFIHRDIKPDNIYLRDNGTPVLLDFGSARQAMGVATRTLTALVTPGYAPLEQYDTSRTGEKKQGTWTDIYALGATMYRAVTGHGPPDAMARVNAVVGGQDVYVRAADAVPGQYTPSFLAAIDWALEFLPENRPQTVDDWRGALTGRITPPPPVIGQSAAGHVFTAAPTAATATGAESDDAPTEILRTSAGAHGEVTEVPKPQGASAPPKMVATDRIAADRAPANKPPVTAPPRADEPNTALRALGVVLVILFVVALGAWYLVTPPPALVTNGDKVATAPVEREASQTDDEAAREVERQRVQEQAKLEAERAEEEAKQKAERERLRARAEAERERAEIERLLREAAADVAAYRLTTPPENNAFARFQLVLAKEPGNAKATQGLKAILDRYLVLAKAAVEEDDFDLARRYLDKAGSVSPGAESVAAARAALDDRVKANERERVEREAQAQLAAEKERQRLEAARLAAEEERRRMEAARLAAEEERRRIEAERQAELERQRLEQEAQVLEKMEADFQRAQEIAALLAAAKNDYAENRSTSPAEDNAMERYRSVLSIDGENGEAKAGLKRIADDHVELATKAIVAYRFTAAERYLDMAADIFPDTETIAPARDKLRAGVAAYDGTKPISNTPYRLTFLPVTGNHTCSGEDPMPGIDSFGRKYLERHVDVAYVPTSIAPSESWKPSGVDREPRLDRLYALGREVKLDGTLMYWFSAVGVQCDKVHVDVYLVDVQAKRIYKDKGTESDLKDLTNLLMYRFKEGREKLTN